MLAFTRGDYLEAAIYIFSLAFTVCVLFAVSNDVARWWHKRQRTLRSRGLRAPSNVILYPPRRAAPPVEPFDQDRQA